MPLVDMPLAELEKYEGRTPRPSNFDEFWDAGLSELDSIDPNVELIPKSFLCESAELFELRFTSVGGARIFAKYLRPKGRKAVPAIL